MTGLNLILEKLEKITPFLEHILKYKHLLNLKDRRKTSRKIN